MYRGKIFQKASLQGHSCWLSISLGAFSKRHTIRSKGTDVPYYKKANRMTKDNYMPVNPEHNDGMAIMRFIQNRPCQAHSILYNETRNKIERDSTVLLL